MPDLGASSAHENFMAWHVAEHVMVTPVTPASTSFLEKMSRKPTQFGMLGALHLYQNSGNSENVVHSM